MKRFNNSFSCNPSENMAGECIIYIVQYRNRLRPDPSSRLQRGQKCRTERFFSPAAAVLSVCFLVHCAETICTFKELQ